jgi:phthalate 4,5-dioxygenase
MLTNEDNEILTRVGPGTPMGNLLRRYWVPALLSSEVPAPDSPPVRVRLLCEDLVAFRDSNGKVGLVQQACPHRGASVFFGRNEEAGLRCVYHGWKFDVSGACVDMPPEPADSNFKNKVRIGAYPTHESGGLIWTYMGPPEKQPAFRDFGTDALPKEQWRASKVISTCNWVQGIEGNIDTAHIAFLHGGRPPGAPPRDDGGAEVFDQPGYPPPGTRGARAQAPALEIADTWYGYRYAGLRKTPKGYVNARVSDFIMPFLTYVPNPYGPLGGDNLLMMVPIDDHSFWRISVGTKPRADLARDNRETRAGAGLLPSQGIIERTQWAENDYLIDREAQRTTSYTGIEGIAQQDLAVTESMGAIYDRSREHLGTTDLAVIRMRRMLIKAARELEQGVEPIGLDGSMAFDKIRSAERILDHGQDWRELGTAADTLVKELETTIVA